VKKNKNKQCWSTTTSISSKWTINSHLKSLHTKQRTTRHLPLEIKESWEYNVAGLNRLMASQPIHYW